MRTSSLSQVNSLVLDRANLLALINAYEHRPDHCLNQPNAVDAEDIDGIAGAVIAAIRKRIARFELELRGLGVKVDEP